MTATLSFVGCSGSGSSIAPVSGKVTSGGAPVAGVRVTFSPMPNDDSTDLGPWSTGVTNAQGEYTLETRYNKKGAAVGKNAVSFQFDDPDDRETLQDDLEEAREDGSAADVAAVKKRIAAFQQLQKGRPKIAEEFTLYEEVLAGGTSTADFELPK